jgi:hypothetical protein
LLQLRGAWTHDEELSTEEEGTSAALRRRRGVGAAVMARCAMLCLGGVCWK